MELSLPEFPSDPVGRTIFGCTVILIVLSALPLFMPHFCKRLWALVEKTTRPGSIGELRVAGAFVVGLGLSSLLFDQPFIVLALGSAIGFAAFGRILSMMSDQAVTFTNFLVLLLQLVVSGVMLTSFFDVWSPESSYSLPETFQQQIVFVIYAIFILLGAMGLFAPKLSMTAIGLTVAENQQGGEAAFRSAGGFLLGLAVASLLLENPILDLSMGVSLFFACLGRIAALVFDRGNLRFNLVLLALQSVATFLLFGTVFGYF